MSLPPKVGMIGIGNIGLPIARNVMGKGIGLLGLDLHNMDAFIASGGIAADSPAEIAGAVEIVIHCIPPEALDGVLNGPDGLLAAKAPRLRTVVEISTYPLETKRALRDRLAERGIALLDCEMSGTARMIASRENALYVSGEDEVVARCRFLLEAISDRMIHVGPFGTSLTLKLMANLLVAVNALATAETVALARRLGLDPLKAKEALMMGTSGSKILDHFAPLMIEGDFFKSKGPHQTFHKYLELGEGLLDEAHAEAPLFRKALEVHRRMEGKFPGEDITAVIKVLREEI